MVSSARQTFFGGGHMEAYVLSSGSWESTGAIQPSQLQWWERNGVEEADKYQDMI